MKTKGGQVEANVRATQRVSAEQNPTTALHRVLENSADELLWVAEVMAGSRAAGEQCLAEAIGFAETAQYVKAEWMLSWLKRLLVHAALKRISGQIRELLALPGARSALRLARAVGSAPDRQELRAIPPQTIIASLGVLERACFILYVYLDYPLLDCALLLGCPRGWIESVCERVLTKFAAIDQSRQNDFRDVDSFISPGVTECAS